MKDAFTVTDLNNYIKILIDRDEVLQSVCVLGEVSNFKRNNISGHLYFSIKDNKSIIKCVMFSQNVNKNLIEIKDGINIYIYGYISCYITNGQYQFYSYRIIPAGTGQINEALENLKNKFLTEGLFEESRKKKITKLPNCIGVITSVGGAVIHDIKSVLLRRNPFVKIFVYSVNVQGDKSVSQIVKGIDYLNSIEEIDTIILGRGGGSIEELWVFNEEEVVRAISASNKPIISAVGHDVDYTLCDLVADVRASTPSVAAEISSADVFEYINNIKKSYYEINILVKNKIIECVKKLNLMKNKLNNFNPNIKILKIKSKLFENRIIFRNFVNSALNDKKNILLKLKNNLFLLDPFRILEKGYVLVTNNGKIIKDPNLIKEGMELNLVFSKSIVNLKVNDIFLKNNFM